MKPISSIVFSFFCCVLISFVNKSDVGSSKKYLSVPSQKDSTELVSSWSYIEFNDGFHWEKVSQMKDGVLGYEFKSDGTLIKRHPKNWFEDPAVTYEDYKGTWKMLSPDMIEMFYNFPNGRRVRESVFINIFEDGKMVWQRLGWEEVGK